MNRRTPVAGGRSGVDGATPSPPIDPDLPPSDFIGRAAELSRLSTRLRAILDGESQICIVAGEAGIGKTRIAAEVARVAERDGIRALWGRSHDDAGEPPFWPWSQALRTHVASLSDAELRAAVAGAPQIAAILPSLRDRHPGTPSVPPLRSAQARFAAFASCASFLTRATERTPVLLILDDFHWADDASVRLLRFLAREPFPARILILATLRGSEARRRPEIQSSLADLFRTALHIDLSGLAEDEVTRLAEVSLGRTVDRELGRRLYELSGGNPFFVRELVRSPDFLRDVRPSALDRAPVPARVQATVRQRIAPLALDTRRILELAAVVGEEFEIETLCAASRASASIVIERIDEAARDSLVAQRSGGAYAFAHAVVRETLYEAIPHSRRCRLHLSVARAIERSVGSKGDERAASLVRHYESAAAGAAPRAAVRARAVDCAVRAAEHARARFAFEDAATYLSRALALLGDHDGRARSRTELLLLLGEARACSGDKTAARAIFAEAAARAQPQDRWTLLARAAIGFAGTWVRLVVREDPEVVAMLEQALAVAPPRGALALRARLEARLAMEIVDPTSAERRRALADRAVASARRSHDAHALAFALSVRHVVADDSDPLERRLAMASEVVDLARSLHNDELAADGVSLLVRDHLEAGRVGELERAIAEQTRLAERLRQPQALWHAALRRVMHALLLGRLADADAFADQAEALGDLAQVASPQFVLGLQRTMIRREQDRIAEIAPTLQAMAAATFDHPLTRFWMAWLHGALGRRHQAESDLDAVASVGFATTLRGQERLLALTLAAETCNGLGATRHAESLRDLLLPHAGRNVLVGNALALVDCVSRPLGLVCATLGRHDEAVTHLEHALETYRCMGAIARATRTRLDLAEVLLTSGSDADRRRANALLDEAASTGGELGLHSVRDRARAAAGAALRPAAALGTGASPRSEERCLFRRDGEYWDVGFAGQVPFRLRDSRGMRQLARLLATPREAVLALDLVASTEAGRPGVRPEPRRALPGTHVLRHLGDAGELLDVRSREIYRERIADLRAELERAQADNDIAGSSAARSEIEAIEAELTAGFDRRGRPRRAASHLERARISTTRTIRDAIRRIAAHDPRLGDHLSRAVRTGRSCCYDPPLDATPTWQLG